MEDKEEKFKRGVLWVLGILFAYTLIKMILTSTSYYF